MCAKFDVAVDYIFCYKVNIIYSRECQNSLPTLTGFIARTKRVSNIELHIARGKTNKTMDHAQNPTKKKIASKVIAHLV